MSQFNVEVWLRTINLPEYAKAFDEEGYDRLDSIAELELKDLMEIPKMKKGHARLILKKVAELNKRPSSAAPPALPVAPPALPVKAMETSMSGRKDLAKASSPDTGAAGMRLSNAPPSVNFPPVGLAGNGPAQNGMNQDQSVPQGVPMGPPRGSKSGPPGPAYNYGPPRPPQHYQGYYPYGPQGLPRPPRESMSNINQPNGGPHPGALGPRPTGPMQQHGPRPPNTLGPRGSVMGPPPRKGSSNLGPRPTGPNGSPLTSVAGNPGGAPQPVPTGQPGPGAPPPPSYYGYGPRGPPNALSHRPTGGAPPGRMSMGNALGPRQSGAMRPYMPYGYGPPPGSYGFPGPFGPSGPQQPGGPQQGGGSVAPPVNNIPGPPPTAAALPVADGKGPKKGAAPKKKEGASILTDGPKGTDSGKTKGSRKKKADGDQLTRTSTKKTKVNGTGDGPARTSTKKAKADQNGGSGHIVAADGTRVMPEKPTEQAANTLGVKYSTIQPRPNPTGGLGSNGQAAPVPAPAPLEVKKKARKPYTKRDPNAVAATKKPGKQKSVDAADKSTTKAKEIDSADSPTKPKGTDSVSMPVGANTKSETPPVTVPTTAAGNKPVASPPAESKKVPVPPAPKPMAIDAKAVEKVEVESDAKTKDSVPSAEASDEDSEEEPILTSEEIAKAEKRSKTVCSLCARGDNVDDLGELDGPYQNAKKSMDDIWVHENCAEFTPEFYVNEENVPCGLPSIVKRGSKTKCNHCKLFGATIGCQLKSCKKSFHYPCIKAAGGVRRRRDEEFPVFCITHKEYIDKDPSEKQEKAEKSKAKTVTTKRSTATSSKADTNPRRLGSRTSSRRSKPATPSTRASRRNL